MATLFLATVIGWYFVIISLFLIIQHQHLKSIVDEILDQRGLIFIMAILTLIMGLLMVASHNVWVMGWPVVITLIAWLVLISGLLRLFCLDTVIKMGKSFVDHPNKIIIAGVVYLLIGLFLLFHVYWV